MLKATKWLLRRFDFGSWLSLILSLFYIAKMAQTLDDALLAASRAVQSDKNNQYKQALYYYDIAIKLLTKLELDDMYKEKLSDYRDRISSIQQLSKLFDDDIEIY